MTSFKIYNTDTHKRGGGFRETRLPRETPEHEVLERVRQDAVRYGATSATVVKTSYRSPTRPGSWYIKLFRTTYEELRLLLEKNERNELRSCRTCYLIRL